jgi:hypothetical protein
MRHPLRHALWLFARWSRLGLWRLLGRLYRDWRRACGDAPEPSAVVIDSRSYRSAPSCFDRGIDGGKKIKGVKIQVAVDKYGFPLGIDVSPANPHDTKGIVPVLRQLADRGSSVRRWGISATGASGWRKPARLSASPSRPLPTAAMDASFRPASAGWLSGRSHG